MVEQFSLEKIARMNQGAFLMPPGKGSWRVQPDCPRLQSPAGTQYRGVHDVDGGGTGLKARFAHYKWFVPPTECDQTAAHPDLLSGSERLLLQPPEGVDAVRASPQRVYTRPDKILHRLLRIKNLNKGE